MKIANLTHRLQNKSDVRGPNGPVTMLFLSHGPSPERCTVGATRDMKTSRETQLYENGLM